MMISSVGFNQSQMGPRFGGNCRPDPSEMFNKVDQDGSGGLDQTEFQTLSDKIGEATGGEVDVVELFGTYDEDGDGVLSETETQAVMEAHRPSGPPPGGGMMGGMGGMQGPPPAPAEMFSDADEDDDGSLSETEAEGLAEMISNATGEEMDVEQLFAAYDEDEDGLLSEEETQTALEANRPEGPPPPKGGMAGSEISDSTTSAGIENYLRMAALGTSQHPSSNMSSMFSGQNSGFVSGNLHVVNTLA
jgi:Ca2+-binding EF-hand superfamily protein